MAKEKAEVNAMEITKNTTMGDMLEYDRGIGVVLMEAGMHCVGCPASIGETLARFTASTAMLSSNQSQTISLQNNML